MYSISILLFSSLFMQLADDGQQKQPPARVPVPTPTQHAPIGSTERPNQATPLADPKHFYDSNAMLELPRENRALLAAPERAVLRSLHTEKRDAAGNIMLDSNGNPIMVPVRRGMYVFKGQLLAIFEDRELQSVKKINEAQLDVAKAERDKKIEIEYAAKGVQLAMLEHKLMLTANESFAGTYGKLELEKGKFAIEQALASLDVATYNIEEVKTREVTVREYELERTSVQIELRRVFATIDGMIVDIKASEGEWLREGDPILHIVQLDTLWVKVQVAPREYDIDALFGRQATVRVPLARGLAETFTGTVVFCDPNINASKKYEAFVEIQNPRKGPFWLLQPGMDGVEVVIPL